MKNILLAIILALLVWVSTYAFLTSYTPQQLAERQNKQAIRKCIESISYEWTVQEVQKALKVCKELELIQVINPKVEKSTTTGSVIPEASWTWNIGISLECEFWLIDKIEWIEWHYTATDNETTLQSLKNGHISRGMEHIGYHYVIKPDWWVVNTRNEKCVAWADKWSHNNFRFIQIAFIWNDKPNKIQSEKMAILTRELQLKYKLPIDSVSAHSEWWPKSKKESFDYWFGSKAEFIKKIRYYYVISIYWNGSSELQYMWRAWGDLDFIATIFAESRFNANSVWDGGNSIWYCQIHKWYQPWWYEEYIMLGTMEQKLNYCHEKYTYAKWLKWWIGSRFHWYNAKDKHLKNIVIE